MYYEKNEKNIYKEQIFNNSNWRISSDLNNTYDISEIDNNEEVR